MIHLLRTCVLAVLFVPLSGEARADEAWLLRDRLTKLHLVAAGFLDDEVDRVSMKTVAKALLSFRQAYQLTPEAGAISNADLEKLIGSTSEVPHNREILAKSLTPAEIEILRGAHKDFGKQFQLTETRSVHDVTFQHPKLLQVATPPSEPYQAYEHPGPPEERKRYEARVIIDGINVISVPSNGRTLLSRFQEILNKHGNESTEALSLSSDRYVSRLVYRNEEEETKTERAYLRGYVAGDRFIGIHLRTNVYPSPDFVPLESHKRHAELIVKNKTFKTWLTPGQCEEYKIRCGGKGNQGDSVTIQEPERIKLVNAVAWRLMSGSIASYIFSHFDDAPADSFETVRLSLTGASRMPDDAIRKLKDRFGIDLAEGYGLTEAAPVVTSSTGMPVRLGSVGRVLVGEEVRLVGDDGEDVPAGDAGEIWVRGANVFQGYWHDPEATARVLRDGWLRTGDIATTDDDGYLYLVDRAKDLIIVSGFNVYPAEVEEVLAEHPAVADVAVIGVPHPHQGEAVKAYVVRTPGVDVDEDALIEHCTAFLARYKCPSKVIFVDQLPRNASGKVVRRELEGTVIAG